MPWNVAVEPLVNPEEAEEMGRNLIRRRPPFPLPKQRVQIVCPAEDSALAYVERLCEGLQVDQPAGELEVRV